MRMHSAAAQQCRARDLHATSLLMLIHAGCIGCALCICRIMFMPMHAQDDDDDRPSHRPSYDDDDEADDDSSGSHPIGASSSEPRRYPSNDKFTMIIQDPQDVNNQIICHNKALRNMIHAFIRACTILDPHTPPPVSELSCVW